MFLRRLLCFWITVSFVSTLIIPPEVLLAQQDGLSKTCTVNCDHLQTVTKSKIGALITTLSDDKMSQITKAIRFALDL